MRKIYALLALLGFACTVHAQLVFNENFTGYTLGNLAGQGLWITNADPNPDIQVAATTGMVYTGYTSGGNYISVNGATNAKDDYKLFSVPIATGVAKTIYMSFVVRATDPATNTSSAGDYSITLLNSANGTLPCRFYVRAQNGNNRRIFGVGIGSEVPDYFNTGNSSATNVFLIVIRYDIGVGAADDAAYMWVNPSLASEPLVANANASHVGTGEVAYGSQINGLMVHQSGNNSPNADFDGLRVSTGLSSALAWQNLAPQGAPLPVKLDNFDAAKDGSGVKLVWNTSDEIGVGSYQIERSQNGVDFVSIGTVTADKRKAYAFTDAQPGVDNNFYRLKMVDLDGNYKLSHVVSIKSKASINIILSPNPVKDKLLVQHPKATAGNTVQVVNADGRVVSETQVPVNAVQTAVDLSRQRSGLYHIVFKTATGLFTNTIIKQ